MAQNLRRIDARVIAVQVLTQVLNGQPLEDALHNYWHYENASFVSHLCYETLRHYYSLKEQLTNQLHKNQTTLTVKPGVLY